MAASAKRHEKTLQRIIPKELFRQIKGERYENSISSLLVENRKH